MKQKTNSILIERENLQNGFFSAYTEKENIIGCNSDGHFSFLETSFDNLQFIHCDYTLFDSKDVCVNIDSEVLEMHFCLSGESKLLKKNEDVLLKTGHHMLRFQSSQQQEILMSPAEKARFYEIRIGFSHFEKLMGDFCPHSSGMFSNTPFAITPEMYAIVSQLTNTAYLGQMKTLFLEAKMTELFLLQLQQQRQFSEKKTFSFKKSDKDKIYDARQLLKEHLNEFVTISRLAQLVGINKRKLALGFKEIFGYTVYQYIIDLKMQTAKSLLLDGNMNVNEIAYHIGYQNSQHFISAFKRKFGISPGKMKA